MNFVLMHGGWHGGWCWTRVARLLRQRGHSVFTPTQTGLGERAQLLRDDITLETFVQDLVCVLHTEEICDAVLVGHSVGGAAISGAADRAPERVQSLVYLDAVILQNGETLADHFSPMQKAAYEALLAAGSTIAQPPSAAFFGVQAGPDSDWVNRRMTPMSLSMVESPLRLMNPIGNGLPCVYVACTAPQHPFVAAAHHWARGRTGWQWYELETGHDAMVTAPDLLATLLESLT